MEGYLNLGWGYPPRSCSLAQFASVYADWIERMVPVNDKVNCAGMKSSSAAKIADALRHVHFRRGIHFEHF